MADELDRTNEREEAFLQQRLAPHLETKLSDDEVEAIAEADSVVNVAYPFPLHDCGPTLTPTVASVVSKIGRTVDD